MKKLNYIFKIISYHNINILMAIILINTGIYAQNWNQVTKISPSDRAENDFFGFSVSISGNYAIVGAWQEDEDSTNGNTITDSGSAYIFEKDSNGQWNQVQKIVASDRSSYDRFGYSVSISGNYAIVGAYWEDEDILGGNTVFNAGSAYIFERDGSGHWNQVQKIVPSDRNTGNNFGYSVSINGNYAIIGAYLESEGLPGEYSIQSAGTAYIFKKNSNGDWYQVQKIVASDREAVDNFGCSVAINGNYAIVGANFEDHDETGLNPIMDAGSAYIFEKNNNGQWNQVQKIVASDRNSSDRFGTSVSISGDYAIIGAYLNDEDINVGNIDEGAAYIFKRNNSGYWNQTQKIVASDRSTGDLFGYSVSISDNYAIVGAYLNDQDEMGNNSLYSAGSAYIFEKDSGENWNQIQKIVASDRTDGDFFGYSVSINDDGHAIIGAYEDREDITGGNPLNNAGSAYIFEKSNNTGMIENDFGNDLKVYPNPTNGFLLVELDKVYTTIKVNITDATGKCIQKNIYNHTNLLNFTFNNPNGVYFITIQTDKKEAIIKVIKQ